MPVWLLVLQSLAVHPCVAPWNSLPMEVLEAPDHFHKELLKIELIKKPSSWIDVVAMMVQ